MAERKIVDWFTMNGKHIPIYEGESKADAVNRSIAKDNEDKKAEQIRKNKEQADKLNGKSEEYQTFKRDSNPIPWLKQNSNWADWENTFYRYDEEDETDNWDGLSDTKDAIKWFTASGYHEINGALYKKKWDDISEKNQQNIENIRNGLDRFEINKGLEVARQSDFVMLGKQPYEKMSIDDVKSFFSQNDGVFQNDGFMSFSMDDTGRAIMGKKGLVTHLRIPPSKGAGMYVGDLSAHPKEQEFLLNDRAVLKYDVDSLHQDGDGNIHVTAYWLGQADKRTIDR